MKLQAPISDASEKKLISYKAKLEQDGKKRSMGEVMESFIQNARFDP